MSDPVATFRERPEKAAERTAALKLSLRTRYAAPEWLLFEEISLDGIGRADALAINCYSSSGFEIHGFEIKASRSDWMRELRRMAKSAAAFEQCNRWWLVAPADVAVKDELPPGWGWLQLDAGGRLRKVVQAPHRQTRPIGMRQLVNLLSRKHPRYVETPEEGRLAARREYDRGFKDGQRTNFDFDRTRIEALDAFERKTGMSLYSANVERVAEAVLYVLQHGDRDLKRSVQASRADAVRFLERTEWAK